MKIQLLVLANSKKAGGRCLAGIDTQTLQWIRPITDHQHCEVPTAFTLNKETNRQLRPLDLIEIEITEPLPLKYQRENWLCKPESIIPKGTLTLDKAYPKLIPEIELTTWFLADSEVKINPEVYKRYKTNAPSLALIEVPKVKLFHNRHGSRRISFVHGRTAWDLPFTDDYYEGADSDLGRSLLCLSIGEEWKPNWEPTDKKWHYKLVAGLIVLPGTRNLVEPSGAPVGAPSADSLMSFCERLFKFIPGIKEDRQKPLRFASSGWVYQNRVSLNCPTCNNPNLLVFRKHFKKFAKDMHYWGIVCSVCRDAKDSKDFTKDFIKKVGLELEETTPIGENCGICISNSKNY
jgi:hypothetical protein